MRKITCRFCDGKGYVEPPYELEGPPRIVSDPGVCGGAPRIEGTRITVAAIQAIAKDRDLEPADIVWLYPVLTEAHVKAALDFGSSDDA